MGVDDPKKAFDIFIVILPVVDPVVVSSQLPVEGLLAHRAMMGLDYVNITDAQDLPSKVSFIISKAL